MSDRPLTAGSDEPETAPEALLRLPDTRAETLGRLGRSTSAIDRLARVLGLQRLAIAAEREGFFKRADFYFRRRDEALAALESDPSAWVAIAAWAASLPGGDALAVPERLRGAVLRELLVDVHLAFFHGRTRSGDALPRGDRAYMHSDRALQLLEKLGASQEERFGALAPLVESWLGTLEPQDRVEDVPRFVSSLLDRDPPLAELPRWARLRMSVALASVYKRGESSSRLADIDTLGLAIDHLQRVRTRHPDELGCYEPLGLLCHVRAMQLRGALQHDRALVDAQRAVLLLPGVEMARQSFEGIHTEIVELQGVYRELDKQLAAGGAALNAKGYQLKRVAESGFAPLEAFRASEESRKVTEGMARAQTRSAWRLAGMPDDQALFERSATAWLGVTSWIIDQAPETSQAIAGLWQRACTGDSSAHPALAQALSDVPVHLALAFLEKRLLDKDAAGRDAQEPAPPPSLPSPKLPAKADGIPLREWFSSRDSTRVKLQLVASIALGAYAFYAYATEASRAAYRDDRYRVLEAAAERADYPQVLAAAEAFLTSRARHPIKQREARVWSLYDEALVGWFAGLDGELAATDRARIDRYKQLSAQRPETNEEVTP